MSLEIFNLRGSLALITGSGRGIGLAIAHGLGAAGAELIINGRDMQKLAAANAEFEARGLKSTAHAFDVTDEAAVTAAID
jgi:gluconate 5-dehydrogenase